MSAGQLKVNSLRNRLNRIDSQIDLLNNSNEAFSICETVKRTKIEIKFNFCDKVEQIFSEKKKCNCTQFLRSMVKKNY